VLEYQDDYSAEKEKLFILICGPYAGSSFSRLEKLRDFLKNSGYKNSNLATDLSDPPGTEGKHGDELNYLKSIHWIKQSDVNLFVFFKDVDYNTVTIEMAEHFHGDADKIKCASFFVEDLMRLQTGERGLLDHYKKVRIEFDDDDELQIFAKNACWNHLTEDDCG